MKIAKHHRKNFKKLLDSVERINASSILGINPFDLPQVAFTNDPVKFYESYDVLCQHRVIKDKDRIQSLRIASIANVQKTNTLLETNISQNLNPTLETFIDDDASSAETNNIVSTEESSNTTKTVRANKIRYNLMIDEDILENLKIEAEKSDRSVSSVIRIAVKQYLEGKLS